MIYSNNEETLNRIRPTFKDFNPPKKYAPYEQEILDKIQEFFLATISQHPRVKFYRADLRFPETCNPGSPYESDAPTYHVRSDSSVISRFSDSLRVRIRSYLSKYKRSISVTNILWVRELSKKSGYHYHVIVALNANSFFHLGDYNSSESLAGMICKAWNSALGITTEAPYFVHFSNAHFIDTTSSYSELMPKLRDTYIHFSYLAKSDTKPKGDCLRNFGCSNLNETYWSLEAQKIERRGL
jgi:hypothetical protein